MKKLIVVLLLVITGISFAQNTAKTLTTADSVLDVGGQSDWIEIAVSDTGAADTVLVYAPAATITGTTGWALIGTIRELATNNNVVGLYGDADTKVYQLWAFYPRGLRFILSDNASGSVYLHVYGKP